MISLRKLINEDFGIDLPIKGSTGNSIENPVIIEWTPNDDFVSVEFAYLRCIGMARGIEWKFISQKQMNHDGKKIDRLTIKTRQFGLSEIITQQENYYFDITDWIDKSPTDSNVREN
jgi:hypothetical protein